MNMSIKRKIDQVDRPPAQPGFLGLGHTARPVIQRRFSESDPFIMLMDDMLDKKDDNPAGGPHPHAGFETVTLLLQGEIGDDTHTMKAGDFQLMTAGSGVVHSETIKKKSTMRLLQLWLNLPKKYRWAAPRLQDLPADHVPVLNENGVTIKLYSGTLSGLISPVLNYTPLVIADITIEPGTTSVQQIPANFNSFLYVLRGNVKVGDDEKQLNEDEVGWLNLVSNDELSEVKLIAGEKGVRFILYAGKPTGDSIVSHGPFIADSSEDINRLYREFRQGKMKHISTVPDNQKLSL
jgi:redox-sensitive bicupin YhaK (pirin superfamily)